jgi:hypothetical protein
LPVKNISLNRLLVVGVAADQQVVQHGGVLEQLDVLEGARNAQRRDLVRRLVGQALPQVVMLPVVGV